MSFLRHFLVSAAALLMAATLSSTAQAADEIVTVKRTGEVSAQARTAWVNNNTGRCLSVRGANNVNGAPAFQLDCNSYADQFWNIEAVGGDKWRIRNAYTGRCLAIRGADNFNGSSAFQIDCLNYADQHWNIIDVFQNGQYVYSFARNSFTGRCLAVSAANNVNGAPAFQYDCNTSYNDQQWKVYNV